ncbi:response regulator [Geomonas paludis]|uniref:Response regulator n=1 Tax=Geomonas paludis TaxID=2740185 RepID=A0A6V8MZP5_9BACT|nr:response regulator [Geomonas paludis]UPU34018.1 response regulator [Geomonas paludis]GFO65708.1 response regulator [Geomonas paludis]
MSYVHHTILLVDNDQDQAHFTRLALQRVGVITPVQSARDGEEAIGYLSGRGVFQDRDSYPMPVLMLLDLQLPHISGVGLLSWLREQPALKRLPVVVLTTPVPAADLNRAYELGCNSFLFKPNSFNALLVMMQNLVQYWLGLNVAPELAAHPPAQEQSGTSV